MLRPVIASVVSIVYLCVAAAEEPQEKDPQAKPSICLTEKDFDRVVRAKNGEVIELRLPYSMPYSWALVEELPVLRPVPPARPPAEPKRGPNSPPPKVGGSPSSVHRYTVTTDR